MTRLCLTPLCFQGTLIALDFVHSYCGILWQYCFVVKCDIETGL